MADFVLKNNENVTVAVGAVDALGTPVTVTFDTGTVTATVTSGAVVATVSADELSVNVKAVGPLVTGDILTVNGSVNGVALTAATLGFDVTASAPVGITLTPGTPVLN